MSGGWSKLKLGIRVSRDVQPMSAVEHEAAIVGIFDALILRVLIIAIDDDLWDDIRGVGKETLRVAFVFFLPKKKFILELPQRLDFLGARGWHCIPLSI